MRSLIEKNLDRTSIQTSPAELLKTLRYFCLSMASILLSLIFPIAEWQFLTLAIITGAKWIADSKHTQIIIIERG